MCSQAKRPYHVHERPSGAFVDDYRNEVLEAHLQGRPLDPYFERLLANISDTRNLHVAYQYLAHNGGQAPGPNGQSYRDLSRRQTWQLIRDLSAGLCDETYRPGAVRPVVAHKDCGGERVLRLRDIQDRVVERGVQQMVQPLTAWSFTSSTFSGRMGYGRMEALATMSALCQQAGDVTIITDDIRKAFDNVPHSQLMRAVEAALPCRRTCLLIRNVVDNGTGRGINQGGPLSPWLLEIYLNRVLDRPWNKKHPEWRLVRYVDDLLLIRPGLVDAQAAYADLRQLLQAAGFSSKGNVETAVVPFVDGSSINWLGYHITRANSSLRFDLAKGSADRFFHHLEEHLLLAHLDDAPYLRAPQIILGTLADAGPAYPFSDRRATCRRITETAASCGFWEIPSECDMELAWKTAAERWKQTCKSMVADVERATVHGGEKRQSGAEMCVKAKVTIHTDGCLLPSKAGGWAFIVSPDDKSKPLVRQARGLRGTTSNRAELMAVIRALEFVGIQPARVVTDSEYVKLGVERLPKWRAQAWKRGGPGNWKPVKNLDLWKQLEGLLSTRPVEICWVRGHSGNLLNEECDRLANEVARLAELRSRRRSSTPHSDWFADAVDVV